MGFTPREVDAMSLWEFMACCEGYSVANGGKSEAGADVSDDDLRAMGIKGF